ncbi:hypothetical protein J6590_081772 [Homalodisca vitripennis]|nr:hypothetical protein J6590_081772 [Homalodisca vitripennis]
MELVNYKPDAATAACPMWFTTPRACSEVIVSEVSPVAVQGHVTPSVNNMPLPSDKARTRSKCDFQSIEDKLDRIISDMEVIKNDYSSLKEDINLIRDDIKQFKEDVTKSVDLCFDEIRDLKASSQSYCVKFNGQTKELDSLKSENNSLKKEVSFLKKRVNSGEQYSRSNYLDIQGVPETKSENILEVVTKVARVVEFNLEPGMVDAVHRLAPNIKNPNAPRGIIVKFCRRIDMEEMRRKAIQKRGFSASNLGLSSEKTVYVNLAMSRETRILWAAVRRFKENNRYKFAWITSSGKIHLRKTEKGPAVLIKDETDLLRLQPSKKQHQPTQ